MLLIRRATAADAEILAAFGRDLNAHQGDPTEYFTSDAVRRDGFGDEPQFSGLIAEQDGQPVGYALFHNAYEAGYAARGLYLCNLYVRPDVRRKGIGRALVAAVAREARTCGRSFVWWAAKEWNSQALAFYRSFGAISEPVIAHAITFDRFEALADEGAIPDRDS